LRIVVLLGPPGAGKGTVASAISGCAGLAVFVTGDVLREAIASGTPLGKKVRHDVESGKLVDDDTILALAREFMAAHPQGVLFDGFPRTVPQAQGLMSLLTSDDDFQVLHLDTEEEIVIGRLGARRVCPECGKIYNLRSNPPRIDDECDECKIPLVRRKDDNDDVIRNRYRVYLDQTAPLVDNFKDYIVRLDGNLGIDEVIAEAKKVLCPA
jgi:adenylate kinase